MLFKLKDCSQPKESFICCECGSKEIKYTEWTVEYEHIFYCSKKCYDSFNANVFTIRKLNFEGFDGLNVVIK